MQPHKEYSEILQLISSYKSGKMLDCKLNPDLRKLIIK